MKNPPSTSKPSPGIVHEGAAHGIWSGTISFSLVAIPVQLVTAVEPGRVSFHLLHRKDYSPLARRMFCPEEGVMVPPEEIIRGYEIGPDKYLLITDEELESVSPERSRTIEIVEFIDMQEVDPIYYDHPYHLVPLKGGEKAYRLLAEVMRRNLDENWWRRYIWGTAEAALGFAGVKFLTVKAADWWAAAKMAKAAEGAEAAKDFVMQGMNENVWHTLDQMAQNGPKHLNLDPAELKSLAQKVLETNGMFESEWTNSLTEGLRSSRALPQGLPLKIPTEVMAFLGY